MSYCSNCGERLQEDAVFCPKCGTKVKGARTSTTEEMRQAFERMGDEMEKAFTLAAKEIQASFQKAKDEYRKSMSKEPIVCSNCGEKNLGDAIYCRNCGNKLATQGKEKEE